MSTTFSIDDDVAEKFRLAVGKKYPSSYGMIKVEVKKAIEERTKALLSE